MGTMTIDDVEEWIIDAHKELARQRGKSLDQHIHDVICDWAVEHGTQQSEGQSDHE